MIKAKVVADSTNGIKNRITTFVVTFPRHILAELNTHRMISKNSASSRAIPFKKMLESVETNPFVPIAWQKDHPGMQGTEYFNEGQAEMLTDTWLISRDAAVKTTRALALGLTVVPPGENSKPVNYGVTKQICNRILEPFMWHTVIITATEWKNFFHLRCPQYTAPNGNTFRSRKDYRQRVRDADAIPTTELGWFKINKAQAEIHMMELAECIWDAMNASKPKVLKEGEWHIPFGDNINLSDLAFLDDTKEELDEVKIKIATARCARVSYTVVGEEDKKPDHGKDIKLHDRLLGMGHMSPFEHCAQCMSADEIAKFTIHNEEHVDYGVSGNFRGFIQYRKLLPNENVEG